MFATKRLGKELTKAKTKLPPGIDLVKADDFKTWEVDIRVLDANPLYTNQIYRLVFIFSNNYPIEPPEVTFIYIPPSKSSSSSTSASSPPQSRTQEVIDLTNDNDNSSSITSTQSSQQQQQQTAIIPDNGHRPIPIHPHIYSNGIICLDLLGTAGWSPVQSVESVCMSIQSMLTGNTKNERPQGDKEFCASMGPRGKDGWTGGGKSGWGRRGLKDVRFDYDDDTV